MSDRFWLSGVTPVDANGAVYPLATIDFFITGTTTPEDTFTTPALTVANANPVVLGSDGRIPIIFLSETRMKCVFKTAAGVQVDGLCFDPIDKSLQRLYAESAPSPTYPGLQWVKISTNVLSERNQANDAWITRGDVDSGVNAASVADVRAGTSDTLAVTPDSLAAIWQRGSAITPSAGTASIPSTGGKHFNLVAGAVTGISATPGGSEFWFLCQGNNALTYDATSFEIDGAGDYSTEAGDIIIAINKAATDVTGANYRVLIVPKNNAVASWTPGSLYGLTISRAGTTTFGIAVGSATNEDTGVRFNMKATSAFTKSVSSFVAGTGNGGLDTGAVGANTWYHVHMIRKTSDGTTDFICSLSATSPTMPAGYVGRRRLGSFLTNGSSQLVAFSQNGDEFLWDAAVIDIDDDNPGTSAVTRTISTPLGVKVLGILSVGVFSGTSYPTVVISSLDVSDQVGQVIATAGLVGFPTGSNVNGSTAGWTFSTHNVRTSTSSTVRSRLSVSGAADRIAIITRGWLDTRGRLA